VWLQSISWRSPGDRAEIEILIRDSLKRPGRGLRRHLDGQRVAISGSFLPERAPIRRLAVVIAGRNHGVALADRQTHTCRRQALRGKRGTCGIDVGHVVHDYIDELDTSSRS